MIQITSTGEQAVEKVTNLMTPRGTVLSLLYEVRAGLEIEDITAQTHMSDDKAATIIRSLINDGLAREV